MTGKVVSVTRFRMAQDGEGISTLVTLFGCPLHCRCCANAFCNEKETPVTYYTAEHLCETLGKDDLYFKMTGGGIVFGGGEPLIQSEFVQEVCRLADPLWKKRIETSLHVKWGDIAPLTDIIDEWIIDIKDMNPEIYKRYTGSSNWLVIRNLKRLADIVPKEKIWLRVPLIDGFNNKDDVKKSVSALQEMGFSRIEEFKYNDFKRTFHKTKNLVTLPRIPRQGYGMMLLPDEARLACLSGSREVKRFDDKFYELAHQLFIKNLKVTRKTEIEILKKKADSGDVSSQVQLGDYYLNEDDCEENYNEAFKWFMKAAEQGDAGGECAIGLMYEQSLGVEEDYNEAFKWYMKAAEQGDADGEWSIGNMYKDGLGVEQDYNEAFKWYMKVAEQGASFGEYEIGNMYAEGLGVEQDYNETVKWYKKAAEKGHAGAQYSLAELYYKGKGVERNKYEAFEWYKKLADKDNIFGVFALEEYFGITDVSDEAKIDEVRAKLLNPTELN